MKKLLLSVSVILGLSPLANAQSAWNFSPEIQITNFAPDAVVMPPAPLKFQVVFIGGHHKVQTLDDSGKPNGETPAKQWHDFIGFTPDKSGSDLGYISVNHERISKDDKIGDGGGMTVFKVKRDPKTDSLIVVDQTLADGRKGKFFNVDFKNTVGETGMNCGGMVGMDGRIWTAEEWFRTSNSSIYGSGNGVRDTADWTINTDIPGDFNGKKVKKYQNFNYMVEIDPIKAKAIRKQYNWGRQGFEGGAMLPDGKTVILGVDDTPAPLVKFVADKKGDFTKGKTYVYKHDKSGNKWIEIDNTKIANMLDFKKKAFTAGATMYNRLEWVNYSKKTKKVYLTETGRDKPGGRWSDEKTLGGVWAPHHLFRATQQGVADPGHADYVDYYGRVISFDPATDKVDVHISGGPEFATASVPMNIYPSKHLSNPDGLNFLNYKEKEYMIICEDLNGSSYGRVPGGVSNRLCEMFLLDMEIQNPTVNDLIRVSAVPNGAEITGAIATPDGKTILVNSQHPKTTNKFPFNNSLTFAITGWDKAIISGVFDRPELKKEGFRMWPNPTSREVELNKVMDVAIYDMNGRRVRVERQVKFIDVSDLPKGTYFLRNLEGETKKLIIQ